MTEYKLFTDTTEPELREAALNIADLFPKFYREALESNNPTTRNMFLAIRDGVLCGAVLIFDYSHTEPNDGYLHTSGTHVIEICRRQGIALEMRNALHEWAIARGYLGIKTDELNQQMRSLLEKQAQEDAMHSYEYRESAREYTITFNRD